MEPTLPSALSARLRRAYGAALARLSRSVKTPLDEPDRGAGFILRPRLFSKHPGATEAGRAPIRMLS